MREFSIPALAVIPATANLAQAVFRRAAEQPQAVIMRRSGPSGASGSWQDVTASQFAGEVVAVAKGLVAAGIRPGDRVALMSHTRYEWTLIDYAIWTAGAVTVPVYETSSAEQAEWILNDSGARACFVETAAYEQAIGGLRDQVPGLEHVWRIEAGGPGDSVTLDSLTADGAGVGDEIITERTVLRPLTPYGATKAAAEMLLGSYANCYGITGAALRFSNVYGPGMGEKDSFIPRLMRAARDGEGGQVRGDGTMLRDVVHVDDIVQGILAAWRGRHNGPLILGSGTSVTVNEMVTTARKVTGAPIPAENVPVGAGEMPAVVLDIAAATALGYRPAYDLEAGMATVWPDFDPKEARA